ncbi:hypothetical protein MT344_08180 [Clavibacter michiganensis subsp. phaseoli]|uniref:hypothetical protein n=1 Tax=Clavibacter phaseoli TaxID=1734031 RepID=UPI001FB4195F|nr:hypothetical protein [Clavibacter phaseoli]MCJ1711154.1 hypothetical protein [Clavibacter phaseoli]
MPPTTRIPTAEHLIDRGAIDAAITHGFNVAGARLGLLPLTWRLGPIDEGVHFSGDADTYAVSQQWDIVEAWIVYLGLADQFEYCDEPIHQEGPNSFWTGTVDDVTVRLCFPASESP